jgi:uncharacterized protein (DUF433 family)
MSQVTSTLIEIRPSRVVGDRAFIAGTRVSVEDVYLRHEMGGQTPDEIVESLPHLNLAQVHAALSYAFSHLVEIRQQMKEGTDFVDQIRSASGPGPLANKLAANSGAADEVPSG